MTCTAETWHSMGREGARSAGSIPGAGLDVDVGSLDRIGADVRLLCRVGAVWKSRAGGNTQSGIKVCTIVDMPDD